MNYIDDFLNSITMYKTVLYGLLLLAFCSILASFFKAVPFTPLLLVLHLLTLAVVCYCSNFIFSKVFKVPANSESYFITALILFFIIPSPFRGFEGIWISALAAVIAMASKYILAIRKRHIFNPAAVSAVLISLIGFGATWWIATPVLVPATVIISLLIVRKVRKFSLFFTFLTIVSLEVLAFGIFYGSPISLSISQLLFSWPIFFFAGIMLTEPLTMPPTRSLQILYAGLVGFLFAFQMPLGFIQLTPELSLLAGNVFAYAVGSKQRIMLSLVKVDKISSSIYNFSFKSSEKLKFSAGQYLEWTLPHKKVDIRGNRRFFTVASSPTEQEIMFGARITDDSSSFKKALLDLDKNNVISAGALAGDFVLPEDKTKKLVFLAGGIGITPFRSMIKYLIDTNDKRDIVLMHTCSRGDDFVYESVFREAFEKIGLKTICLLTEKEGVPKDFKGEVGEMTHELIEKNIPDYKKRVFYISGANAMVNAYESLLKSMGIKNSQIITDYFSGY